MRVLLDTHALIWWLEGDGQFRMSSRRWLARPNTDVLVSAASGWEIATKRRMGVIEDPAGVLDDLRGHIARQGFVPLPVTMDHALRAGAFDVPHGDPFDRMLAGQAQAEGVAIVSQDPIFELFGVKRLW